MKRITSASLSPAAPSSGGNSQPNVEEDLLQKGALPEVIAIAWPRDIEEDVLGHCSLLGSTWRRFGKDLFNLVQVHPVRSGLTGEFVSA